jgi:tRNA G18 (ribose-2'-O)-methylase SpoU
MFHLRQIGSFDAPELAPYRTMRRPADHVAQGIFVAEGDKVVQRLLKDHRFGVVSVVLPPDRLVEFTPLLQARPDDFEVFVAERELLNDLIGFHLYQGVLAIGKIPAPPTMEMILGNAPRPLLLVAADALSNSENVGALIRNCAAFGVHAVLCGETCASPWLRRSVRSSMGTIFQLPVIETASLVQALRGLRSAGVHIVAADAHVDGRTLAQGRFTGDCCIVMGSEGAGIRPEILELCDEAVAIRMPPGVDSLNVTSATSVFLYEASRQRETTQTPPN